MRVIDATIRGQISAYSFCVAESSNGIRYSINRDTFGIDYNILIYGDLVKLLVRENNDVSNAVIASFTEEDMVFLRLKHGL